MRAMEKEVWHCGNFCRDAISDRRKAEKLRQTLPQLFLSGINQSRTLYAAVDIPIAIPSAACGLLGGGTVIEKNWEILRDIERY